MKYFRVNFLDPETKEPNGEMYVKANSMDDIDLWILKNRPMSDYYGAGIVEVNADKSAKKNCDFQCIAIREYYYHDLKTEDDEKIRQILIDAWYRNHAKKSDWTEDQIKEMIQSNDQALYGALKSLYSCQTDEEQAAGQTHAVNGKGFNGVDAPILSSFCEFLDKTGFLTSKQKALARKKLIKYNKQLTNLANCH